MPAYQISLSSLPIHAALKGCVDHPGPGNGNGDLVISGWALAEDGPPSRIEIFADGRCVAHVRPGEARPDIGRDHPDVPRSDASGFRVRLPFASLRPGELIVQAALASGERIPLWMLDISMEGGQRNEPGRPFSAQETLVPGVDDFRVVAIISVFNEADIIDPVLAHLHENGLETYLIDNRSTDDTVERARRWLGKGLLGIETYPPEASAFDEPLAWARLLERKLEVASELGADWYMHHDADEIRDAPWPGMPLRDAVRWVDRLGFNAVEFRLLNFPPVDDGFVEPADPTTYFTRWEEGPEHDRIQRKCWQAGAPDISLADGGHDVRFEGRRLFPIPFLLRHYPIRGQDHGTRKVMSERKGRFAADEIALGWHRQYDDVDVGFDFLRNPASLRSFDLEQVRLETLLVHSDQPRASGGDDGPPAVEYEGVLDGVDSRWIFGWARALGQSGEPVSVDIWDGARKLVTVPADAMRPDLEAGGKGDGRAGFVIHTPREILDGRRHWIWATVAGTADALRGSPAVFRAEVVPAEDAATAGDEASPRGERPAG